MWTFILLAGTTATLAYAFFGVRENKKIDLESIKKFGSKSSRLAPHLLSSVIIAAHASELTKVVGHASYTEILLAGALLTVWVVTNKDSHEI